MGSDKPTGADNQQETSRTRLELDPQWVAGFVDGEGCFCVSVHRNPNARTTGGWQLHPVFQVYQHMRHRAVLEELVPFFERNPLIVKSEDFRRFATIVRSMRRQEHLTPIGFECAVRLAYAMNASGKQRTRSLDEILMGSSETARWARLREAPLPLA